MKKCFHFLLASKTTIFANTTRNKDLILTAIFNSKHKKFYKSTQINIAYGKMHKKELIKLFNSDTSDIMFWFKLRTLKILWNQRFSYVFCTQPDAITMKSAILDKLCNSKKRYGHLNEKKNVESQDWKFDAIEKMQF